MPFIFPHNRELNRIAPDKIARMAQNRLGFTISPMRNVNASLIQWEQPDNVFGLQQLRGLDGAPTVVKPVGVKPYSYIPAVYGEFMTITETELTTRAGSTSVDVPIDVSDFVVQRQDQLLVRELDRIEAIIWTFLTTGTATVTLPGGSTGWTETFAIQTYTASPTWATVATAVPLLDFRAVALLGAGKGVEFRRRRQRLHEPHTLNSLLATPTPATCTASGRRTGATFNSQGDINRVLLDQDVPTVNVYDEGYYDASNTFVRFIPNNKVVVIGQRNAGEKILEYVKTINANNPNRAPGSYSFVVDRANAENGEKRVPPNMEVAPRPQRRAAHRRCRRDGTRQQTASS
jgi:hypothetical protein